MTGPHPARALWTVAEPVHAVVYFPTGEARSAFEGVGLKGFWMGYFGSRAAPLGPVPAEVVVALFFGFHPSMVGRAVPDAWARAAPSAVLDARLALARRAAEGAEATMAGRALYAGYASLPWPGEAHLALWHAATLLREHRGDGHVAVLVEAGLDGCQANVLAAATGRTTREVQRAARGWGDDDWAAGEEGLRARGWLDAAGAATPAGIEARERIEERTDALAAGPADALAGPELDELLAVLARLRALVVAGGGLPFPNPIGLRS